MSAPGSAGRPGDPAARAGVKPAARAGAPRILWTFLLRAFAPRLGGAIALFMVVFLLADLFQNLWRFLSLDAPLAKILPWLLLGIPDHLVQALPVALLFAGSHTVAETYASGELPVIFGSGVSLARYTLPLVAVCAALSAGSFWFEDAVAIGARTSRADRAREMLGQKAQFSASNVTLMSAQGRFVYRIGYYDDAGSALNDVDILERGEDLAPVRRILADRAAWNGRFWLFRNARIYLRQKAPASPAAAAVAGAGRWSSTFATEWSDPALSEAPASFRGIRGEISAMPLRNLRAYAAFLEGAGLPSAAARTELQRRRAFSLSPLIVGLLAAASGGLFRKNALLMSLLLSLSIATAYYVAQMLGTLLAKTGAVPPALGAWFPTALFLAGALVFFFRART